MLKILIPGTQTCKYGRGISWQGPLWSDAGVMQKNSGICFFNYETAFDKVQAAFVWIREGVVSSACLIGRSVRQSCLLPVSPFLYLIYDDKCIPV